MYSLDRAVWSGADGIEPEAGAIFLILLDVRHFRRCGWMALNPLPNPEAFRPKNGTEKLKQSSPYAAIDVSAAAAQFMPCQHRDGLIVVIFMHYKYKVGS